MQSKHRMIIITDTFVGMPGGSERHLYNFCRGASGLFQIDAFQLEPDGNPMLDDGQFPEQPNIRLHSRPIGKLYGLRGFLLFSELFFKIIFNRIDIVVSYHEKADVYNYLLKCIFRRRIVSISSRRDMGFKLTGRLKTIIQRITPSFDALTCPSESIRDLVINEYNADPQRVFVIKNGVELEKYSSITPHEITALKQQLQIPTHGQVLAIIGCLKPVKGHKFLLEGFRQFLNSSDADWTLIMLGEGELQAELQAQAEAAGIANRVIFPGYQYNVHQWLQVTDVVISASLSEGLSNALIEACAAGCPVIATRVGGNPEIVIDGYNGLLVSPENPQDICAALLTLNQDTIIRMGQKAREMANHEYSNTAMVNNLESFYRKQLNMHQ
ncbi:MAG: glycosyltransferase family 4 protein [Oceanospirillaceae bacterium]|nr:glycosyltransferase family 4 protein [Oceanospirillaceae bacterium]MCP5334628.1 glycosyltransferase family 4 protein [Oceanospirillaceae bacterium]MCP5351342.1 glycosyltransferase family 4 protein [Oceanospirillaceae bacterium]